MLQFNYPNSDKEGGKRKKKDADAYADDSESEEESSEGASSEEKRGKKQGRPGGSRTKVKGFSDSDIRRFVKSYKKFGCPMQRLEVIACDAELQEKFPAEILNLAELIQEQVRTELIQDQVK